MSTFVGPVVWGAGWGYQLHFLGLSPGWRGCHTIRNHPHPRAESGLRGISHSENQLVRTISARSESRAGCFKMLPGILVLFKYDEANRMGDDCMRREFEIGTGPKRRGYGRPCRATRGCTRASQEAEE